MLALSVTTAQTSSASSDVYVNSTGGNDGSSGSYYNPYQTIATGASKVDNRGTVHLTKKEHLITTLVQVTMTIT